MKAETVYVKTAAAALAGGVLCLCMLGAGCATEQAFALDTANPTIRYSTQGFLIGDRFVDPKKIPGILESQGVPRERTIHIQIDEEAERNLATPRSFMRFLASRGYTRSVIATKQHNGGFSQFLEISVRRDGVWAGEERVAPASVPARLKARGVPTSSLIVVFLEDASRDALAQNVRRELTKAGYRLVDVVEKHYSDMRIFRMSRAGLSYNAHLIDVEEALPTLAGDGAGKSDRIMVYVDSDCRDRESLLAVNALLKKLEAGGYTSIEKNWTPAAKTASAGAGAGSGQRGNPAALSGAAPRATPRTTQSGAAPRSSGTIRYKRADE